MRINNPENPQFCPEDEAKFEPKEIVMGLHWDPPEEGTHTAPDDLDALCIMFDDQQCVLEVIHPGHPRNANSSVVHTGDAQTGASNWDDERIFVFLEALPDAISAVSFVVSSAQGRALNEVHGASCHISDRITENAWVDIDLSTIEECTTYCIAKLRRSATGWNVSTNAQTLAPQLLSELLCALKDGKARRR